MRITEVNAVTAQSGLYRYIFLGGLVGLTLVGLAGQPVLAQWPGSSGEEPLRVVVALRPGVKTQAALATALSSQDVQVIQQYDTIPGLAAVVTAQGLAELRQRPEVEAVSLDLPVQAALGESVPFIGADRVQRELGITGQGVNVAVLDTGVDTDHPDLAGSLVAQTCFAKSACPPHNTNTGDSAEDDNGHGTHVAGIITSPQGVAPDAGIVAVRVLRSDGSGFTSDIIAAIDWIVAHQSSLNVKAINLSLGGGAYNGVCDNADANTRLYAAAVQAANQAGITVFAASGNRGLTEAMMTPACVSGVIAVGSTYDADLGQLTWGSCADAVTGPDRVTCISNSSAALDLLAPGIEIDSTALGGGQRRESGTSMSTAHASAVAALLAQANPSLTPTDIETILKETGAPVADSRNGRVTPRVDAWAAVNRAAPGQTETISGTVQLQGRTDYSGAQVMVSAKSCQDLTGFANLPGLITTTGPDGRFSLVVLAAGSSPRCLQVTHPGYLAGQHNTPAGNLGVITLPGGDVTGDGVIDIFDLSFIAGRYDGHDAAADINGDGLVDIFDLVMTAGNYDKQGPVVEWK